MPRFHEYFPGRSRVFLPVIHVESAEQAARNVVRAREAGADGVFLIHHHEGYEELLPLAQAAAECYPDWFVGVNCLDLRAHEVVGKLPPGIKGIWSDNAGVRVEGGETMPQLFAEECRKHGWEGLHFGGVAFKYQHQAGTPGQQARAAVGKMDVICTSGSGTGHAMNAEKAREMREAVGNFPLAVASGVSIDNVHELLPYIDAYLVASSIGDSFHELNPKRTRTLAEIIHAYPA